MTPAYGAFGNVKLITQFRIHPVNIISKMDVRYQELRKIIIAYSDYWTKIARNFIMFKMKHNKKIVLTTSCLINILYLPEKHGIVAIW